MTPDLPRYADLSEKGREAYRELWNSAGPRAIGPVVAGAQRDRLARMVDGAASTGVAGALAPAVASKPVTTREDRARRRRSPAFQSLGQRRRA